MANNTVFVNGRTAVTKKSEGTVTAFPNVCKTPTPSGPVPIPYPSIAKSNDLANGSKTVIINGAPVCLENSYISKSTGDEPGSLGGAISGTTGGKAHPISFSSDVIIEGKGVVRNGDLFLSNNKNTPPAPIIQSNSPAPSAAAAAIVSTATKKENPCNYCGKPESECNLQSNLKMGDHLGKPGTLNTRIFSGKNKEDHIWYTGPFSLAAHHIICSKAMKNKDWEHFCKQFGYDINHKNNGVMLPRKMDAACQLHVSVHRGGHSKGWAYDKHLPYPDAVKQQLDKIKELIESGRFCENPSGVIDEINEQSEIILENIDDFTWTITSDGRDYMPHGKGCGNQTSITAQKTELCSCNRHHQIKHFTTKHPLPIKSNPLKTGE